VAGQVVVLDKLDYCGSLNNLKAIASHPSYKFIKGDLQSGDLLSYVLSAERIDTVMHFAAQARARREVCFVGSSDFARAVPHICAWLLRQQTSF
jgi:dTDP-D-glucose 4,6-dehydratase